MGFNIGPRVVRATGGGIKRVGNYRIHHFPPEIVTDGLVLHLDAGNVNSTRVNDPTTLYDLAGNGNNGALTNGAAYQHYFGGTILLNDGSSTDDYINVNNGGSNLMESSFTVDLWLRPTNANTGYQNIWSTQGYDSGGDGWAWYTHNDSVMLWGWKTNGGSNSLMLSVSSMMVAHEWHNYTVTRDIDTTELILYRDGAQAGIMTGCTCNYETTNDGEYSFGSRNGSSSYPLDGYTSGVRGYKRALSATEVLQNYEATKLRHTTSYSATFSPTCSGGGGKVDVLCVGGGGGGGIQHGGGGGAGGYQETTGLSITSGGTYTAVVGMGGTGSAPASTFSGARGVNGGNSVFSGTSITTITSVGGGGGSSMYSGNQSGNSGGSGGGCALDATGGSGTKAGGAGTAGQGFAGGNTLGYSGTNYGGGSGGGGAGGVGQPSYNGSTYIAGAGGPGKTSSISGSPVTYAGGGGGGSHAPFVYGSAGSGGGRGGLGNATSTANGDNAIPRTGGGGGGSGAMTEPGGSGSHGIIIIRYPAEDYNVETLIIGGGGSGGSGSDYAYSGGGGGAGGLLYYSSLNISSGKNYQVRVGKGGASRPANTYHSSNNVSGQDGFNGTDSSFDKKVAFGGGYGGRGLAGGTRAGSGGSGGGGGGRNSYGGYGVSGQGNDGGLSTEHGDTTTRGAGGGGAGGSGGNASNTVNGTPGDGLPFSITGTSKTYSEGGAGGYHNAAGDSNPGQGGRGASGDGGGTEERNATAGAFDGVVYIAYKGPQRGTGGTIDTTSRPGYTIHKFTRPGPDLFVG